MIYAYLVASWFLYFFIHSALASNLLKRYFSPSLYRIFYNLISIVGLIAIFLFSAIQPQQFLLPKSATSQFIGLIFATYGILVMKSAFRQYSLKQFLGFQAPKGDEIKLVQAGVLAYVRHPIYTATILLVAGFFLFSPTALNLVSAVCIYLYLAIGIQLEEKRLIQQFGDVYLNYRKEVPMLIPKGWKLGKLLK